MSVVPHMPLSPAIELARFVFGRCADRRGRPDQSAAQRSGPPLPRATAGRPATGFSDCAADRMDWCGRRANLRHRPRFPLSGARNWPDDDVSSALVGEVGPDQALPPVAMLYVTGDGDFELDSSALDRLRVFLNGGGVLFADPCREGHWEEFAESVEHVASSSSSSPDGSRALAPVVVVATRAGRAQRSAAARSGWHSDQSRRLRVCVARRPEPRRSVAIIFAKHWKSGPTWRSSVSSVADRWTSWTSTRDDDVRAACQWAADLVRNCRARARGPGLSAGRGRRSRVDARPPLGGHRSADIDLGDLTNGRTVSRRHARVRARRGVVPGALRPDHESDQLGWRRRGAARTWRSAWSTVSACRWARSRSSSTSRAAVQLVDDGLIQLEVEPSDVHVEPGAAVTTGCA